MDVRLYRWGFNGKENDNEVKGEGNQQDYGFRIYDPRVARFLNVDPLSKKFPFYTPYQFAGNKPVVAIDLDGLEDVIYYDRINYHETKLTLETAFNLRNAFQNVMYFAADVVFSTSGGYKWRSVVERDENDMPIGLKTVWAGERTNTEQAVATVGDVLGVGSLYMGGHTGELQGVTMLAKSPNATVAGQISHMLGEIPKNIVTHELNEVVKDFKNVAFQVGKNRKLMLDKAGLTHILGRHHPNYRQGLDATIQSNFSNKTTVDNIVGTIRQIVRNNKDRIEQMMSGKGGTQGVFEVNGKTYQLGIDPKNKSRIGQFFEKQ
ncbi:hypothetical protein UNH65_21295 [Chitinophaga sp. 180180018-2]|nr:hypothetical protein [Chitinophaga sp. 212800010-3]